MKKKLLAWIVVISMCLLLYPQMALAATVTIPLDFSGSPADSSGDGWVWAQASKTLTLNGLDMVITASNISGKQYGIKLPAGATLKLTGSSNFIHFNFSGPTWPEGVGVDCPGDLTVVGTSGTPGADVLQVTKTGGDHQAIEMDGNLTLDNVSISGDKVVLMNGSSPTITSALGSYNTLVGNFQAVNATTSGTTLTINGDGELELIQNNTGWSAAVVVNNSDVAISGSGTVTIYGANQAIANANAININNAFTMITGPMITTPTIAPSTLAFHAHTTSSALTLMQDSNPSHDITLPSGGNFTIPAGLNLTVSSGITLTNDAVINNYGTIQNFNELINNGTIWLHGSGFVIGNTVTGTGYIGPVVPVSTSTGNFVTAGRYTITATAGSGGTISPNGSMTVTERGSKTFTFVPDLGYTVDVVLVNGQAVSITGDSYTIENITKNTTIEVRFAWMEQVIDPPETGDVPSIFGPLMVSMAIVFMGAAFLLKKERNL